MKKSFILILFLLVVIPSGCIQGDDVDVKIKQIIPLAPGTSIEISKDLNMSELKFESPQDDIPTNIYFKIPVEIANNKESDFNTVYIKLLCDSPVLDTLYLYSYSGSPFEKVDENTFKFDTKLLAKQSNEILIMGHANGLQQNLIEGTTQVSLEVYGDNGNGEFPLITNVNKVMTIRETNPNIQS